MAFSKIFTIFFITCVIHNGLTSGSNQIKLSNTLNEAHDAKYLIKRQAESTPKQPVISRSYNIIY